MRTSKELLIASKAFAVEHRWRSWWHLASTLAVFVGLSVIAAIDIFWLARIFASLLAGLVGVRLFVIYHDFQHHAILRGSKLAQVIMGMYGLVMLNPSSVWNRSHNHHHKHNSKAFGSSIGSYPIMTTHDFAKAAPRQRLAYAVARHPATMALGYFSVFFWGMCLRPFLIDPRQHWDAGVSIVLNSLMYVYLAMLGFDVLILAWVLPLLVAASLGAYLFYAQHNYPDAKLCSRAEWNHVTAALHSSSYMSMGPFMNWCTGNIGFHHVHHLNAQIPFYRLPEAMAALEELQSPGRTSLRPSDIAACLRLKLWSPEAGRFVGFGEARKTRPA